MENMFLQVGNHVPPGWRLPLSLVTDGIQQSGIFSIEIGSLFVGGREGGKSVNIGSMFLLK